MPLGTFIAPPEQTGAEVILGALGKGFGKGLDEGFSDFFTKQKNQEQGASLANLIPNLDDKQREEFAKLTPETQKSLLPHLFKRAEPGKKEGFTPQQRMDEIFKDEDRAMRDLRDRHGFEKDGIFRFTDPDDTSAIDDFKEEQKSNRKKFAREKAIILDRAGEDIPETLKEMMRTGKPEVNNAAPPDDPTKFPGKFVVRDDTGQIFMAEGDEWVEVFQDEQSGSFFIVKDGQQIQVDPNGSNAF